MFKKDTLASYYAEKYQFTVGKIVSEHDHDSLNITLDDLNEEGMKIYNTIQEKIERGEWEKEILKDAYMETERSGSWNRDDQHLAHNRAIEQGGEYENKIGGIICSWRNMICIFTDGDKSYTPIIVMYADDWLYDCAGKLYKLELNPDLEY